VDVCAGKPTLLVGTCDGTISAWVFSGVPLLDRKAGIRTLDVPGLKMLWEQPGAHSSAVVSLVNAVYSRDHVEVVSGGLDMLVRTWDVSSGALTGEAVTDGSSTSTSAFIPVTGARERNLLVCWVLVCPCRASLVPLGWCCAVLVCQQGSSMA